MVALLVVPTGKKRPRVCGAQCYNAKHPTCYCVCEGSNHQAGLEKAVEQTRETMVTFTVVHPGVRFAQVVHQLKFEEGEECQGN